MANDKPDQEELLRRLEEIQQRQAELNKDIDQLKATIQSLESRSAEEFLLERIRSIQIDPVKPSVSADIKENSGSVSNSISKTPSSSESPIPTVVGPVKQKKQPLQKTNWEAFIGENLISKIGILVILTGVAVGAKYAIDNDLINPLTRIILGYLVGIGLFFFAIRLKHKYINLSAVLLSGAMAVFYFITFAAYDFYGLIPQIAAFGVMVLFTAFTVLAALKYNMQIIANLGLVGAYSVPFALSDGSGNVEILLSYVSLVNLGILTISFKKSWKSVSYLAFGISWLILASWAFTSYDSEKHFDIALIFHYVFFLTFHILFILNKVVSKEPYNLIDVILALVNSGFAYSVGYLAIDSHPYSEDIIGLFTLSHAFFYLLSAYILDRKSGGSKEETYLSLILTITFVAIAVPVQLNGGWVTITWFIITGFLAWIGFRKGIIVFERLSYVLLLLSVLSLLEDYSHVMDQYVTSDPITRIIPILNLHFFTSALGSVIALYMLKEFMTLKERIRSVSISDKSLFELLTVVIYTISLGLPLFAGIMEIQVYFEQIYRDSWINVTDDWGYVTFVSKREIDSTGHIFSIYFLLLYIFVVIIVSLKREVEKGFHAILFVLAAISVGIYLVEGLSILSDLRSSFLNKEYIQYYNYSENILYLRYLGYPIYLLLVLSLTRLNIEGKVMTLSRGVLIQLSIVWVLSAELFNIFDLYVMANSYRIALSVLWGIYSFILVIYGIYRKRKDLRVLAIVLFGVTLIKLFTYDISELNTISKTIAFVLLGALLLTISFMYARFKSLLFEDDNSRDEEK